MNQNVKMKQNENEKNQKIEKWKKKQNENDKNNKKCKNESKRKKHQNENDHLSDTKIDKKRKINQNEKWTKMKMTFSFEKDKKYKKMNQNVQMYQNEKDNFFLKKNEKWQKNMKNEQKIKKWMGHWRDTSGATKRRSGSSKRTSTTRILKTPLHRRQTSRAELRTHDTDTEHETRNTISWFVDTILPTSDEEVGSMMPKPCLHARRHNKPWEWRAWQEMWASLDLFQNLFEKRLLLSFLFFLSSVRWNLSGSCPLKSEILPPSTQILLTPK